MLRPARVVGFVRGSPPNSQYFAWRGNSCHHWMLTRTTPMVSLTTTAVLTKQHQQTTHQLVATRVPWGRCDVWFHEPARPKNTKMVHSIRQRTYPKPGASSGTAQAAHWLGGASPWPGVKTKRLSAWVFSFWDGFGTTVTIFQKERLHQSLDILT